MKPTAIASPPRFPSPFQISSLLRKPPSPSTHNTSPPTMATITASSRTFEIPELLELILIQLARQSKRPRKPKVPRGQRSRSIAPPPRVPRGPPPRVREQLFALQRVNSLFQATLQRSKELRQWMWRRADGDNNLELNKGNSPVKWLIGRMGLRMQGEETDMSVTPREWSSPWDLPGFKGPRAEAVFSNPDASWRRITLSQSFKREVVLIECGYQTGESSS